jgi:predicted membrane-bound spermidine synthase
MLLLVYALIGFASMGCEIAWIRLLDTRFWSTIYSFSLVLSVFLMGIALGGFIFKKYLDNKSNPFLLNLLFILFILNSLAICASLFILIRFPLLFSLTTLKGLILSQGMVCMAAILAPTIITGLCFPLVVRIYTDKLSRIGKSAGLLYSVNTIGGVAGSLAVTFIFIPFIGTAKSLGFFAALLCIVLPVLLFFSFMGKSNIKKPLFILIIPPILMILPLSNFQLSSIAADSGEIVTFYREGPLANLAVIDYKHSPFRRLRINGIRAEGGTNPEALQSQRIQVELPAALHANPEQMLVLGLGTGISLGALKELKKVKAVDCIEISKEIVDASVFFKKENRDILNDPRVTLYLDDARHFTAATQRKYDLIIGDLFFPWLKGSGSLYTVAHFENCKKRLKPGGMVCQWLPLYQFTMENLEIILNTFASVFPSCELWFGHFSPEWPIVMMAGYLEDRKKRQPALAPDIMARYICPVVPHPDKPVTTDMSPKTEFLGADFFKQNFELKTILKYLLDSYTNNDPGIEDVRSKRQYIQSLLEIFILFIEGNIRTPVERLHDLTALDNSLPYAEFVLPQIARKVHDNNLVALVPDLVLFLEKITGRYREDFQLFGYLCKFQLMLKDHEKALGTCSVCTELNPRDENALINLGIAYALTGKDDLAVSAWQRVLSINPYNAKAMINIKRNRENRGME